MESAARRENQEKKMVAMGGVMVRGTMAFGLGINTSDCARVIIFRSRKSAEQYSITRKRPALAAMRSPPMFLFWQKRTRD